MATRYWIGEGNWDDPQHWAARRNGPTGASVPTAQDDVYLESGTLNTQGRHVVCRNLTLGPKPRWYVRLWRRVSRRPSYKNIILGGR